MGWHIFSVQYSYTAKFSILDRDSIYDTLNIVLLLHNSGLDAFSSIMISLAWVRDLEAERNSRTRTPCCLY